MADGSTKVNTGQIIAAWTGLVRRHASLAGLAFGTLAATGLLAELVLGERGGQLAGGVIAFFIQYHLVEHLLAAEGLCDPYRFPRRYGAAFGAAMLSALGVLGAMLLLVVPGLYVGARWSLANALVIGEGMGPVDALRESWRRTAASAWMILGIYMVVALAFVGVLLAFIWGVLAVQGHVATGEGFIEKLFANGVGAMLSVALQLLSVALYALLGQRSARLEDVFG